MMLGGSFCGPQPAPFVINEWRLLTTIGHGSFARVYKAQHERTGALAAIKAVSADKVSHQKMLASLRSEISILRTVVHPNIVKLLDYQHLDRDPEGRTVPTHYLVLEHCDGGDLAGFLDACRRSGARGVDEPTARRLLRMLAMGLGEMHRHNIVHRDLKPGNILLASCGASVLAKIADFGFARALEPARMAATLCGSPLYMAPEVLTEQQYDARSDLWSVGVILFEMLIGHVPFSGNNIVHLKTVIESNEAFVPFDMRAALSPACLDILRRLLQKDPARRLSFGAFFVHPFLSGGPLHSPSARAGAAGATSAAAASALDGAGVLVKEPVAPGGATPRGAIEDEYVILSFEEQAAAAAAGGARPPVDGTDGSGIRYPSALAGITHARDAATGVSSGGATGEEEVQARCEGRLPVQLAEGERLYMAAVSLMDVADSKLVNGDPAASLELTFLAAQLLDRLLVAEVFTSSAAQGHSARGGCPLSHTASDPAARSTSGISCYSSPLGTARSSSGYDGDAAEPRVSPRTVAGAGVGESMFDIPLHDNGPGSHAASAGASARAGGRAPAASGAQRGGGAALAAILRAAPAGDVPLVAASFTRLDAALQAVLSLAEKLASQRGNVSYAQDIRHLLWQGLLSFASSAALDEMFGASNRAATGYAQAALLGWLLHTECEPSRAHAHSSAVDAGADSPWDSGNESPSSRGGPRRTSSASHREAVVSGAGAAPVAMLSSSCLSGASAQQSHTGGAPPPPLHHSLLGITAGAVGLWPLAQEEAAAVKRLLDALELRHAACIASRPGQPA